MIALTGAMAIDHAAAGIRVNAIAPGPIYTPMVYATGMADELRERRRAASPLGVEGTGWDVGYAALFLVSDEARYITGTVLPWTVASRSAARTGERAAPERTREDGVETVASDVSDDMTDGMRTGTRIRSVDRAAHLLMLIASLPEQDRSVNRLAKELGTSVPTVYHLLTRWSTRSC